MMTFEQAHRILSALEREGVRYVVVGSIAMAVHGIVRATRDLDLFVDPSADNVARLKAALRSLFDDPEIEGISATDLAGDYPAIQYVPPEASFWIDLLARLGEVFRFENLEYEDIFVEGVSVRVATPAMLYRMKKDTVRPQDRVDAEEIRRRFEVKED